MMLYTLTNISLLSYGACYGVCVKSYDILHIIVTLKPKQKMFGKNLKKYFI